MMLKKHIRVLATSVLLFTTAFQASASTIKCETVAEIHSARAEEARTEGRRVVDHVEAEAIGKNDVTKTMIRSLLDFAKKHHLDERIVEVGPENRRLKRLVIGIDVRNTEVVRDYLATFNLHSNINNQPVHTLSLEFQKEVEGSYVLGALRTASVPGTNEGIWRYGHDRIDHNSDWFMKWQGNSPSHIIGFAHLIPISTAEAENVDYYLKNPTERGPCKSDNCIAWTTGIELGKTFKDASQDERKPLFNELGVSRSIAHFEIGRRLAHAANDRHVGMVAYYGDDIGVESFRSGKDILPPEPQQPFEDIVKGVIRSAESPVVKALSVVPDGGKVFFPIAAGASPEGMSALIDRAATLPHGVDVHVLVNGISEATFKRGVTTSDGEFRVHALFLGGNMRALYKGGHVDVIPGYLSDFGRNVANPKLTDFHYDAMVVRVSPPNEQGHYSLGPNNDMIKTILRARPGIKVIAEVNPNVPFTEGDNYLTEKQITTKFASTAALAGPALLGAEHREKLIGKFLAELIPNGATVQLGIGGLFGGMPQAMVDSGRHGINFFTEMLGDPMMEMIDSGVADSAKTGFAYGSSKLYRWLDHNPKVRIIETEVSNDPGHIAKIENFHAVNTALQVTLRGDVNATHGADGSRMSSPGGQVEFMSSGIRSAGGKSIIAIRSTIKDDAISAITLDTYGGNVTTPHEMVTHVVTEFGIAELVGRSEAQRAVAMIRIAHPKFRASLAQDALKRGMIKQEAAAEFLGTH